MSNCRSIYSGKTHVANVSSIGGTFYIHNFRPNGSVGVCFTSDNKADITNWLNGTYSKWDGGPLVKDLFERLPDRV